MTLSTFSVCRSICYPHDAPQAVATAAWALSRRWDGPDPEATEAPGKGIHIALADHPWAARLTEQAPATMPWMGAQVHPSGQGIITASHPSLLYAWVHTFSDGLTPDEEEQLERGIYRQASFAWLRPLFDSVLTQVARSCRGFDEAHHIETMARCGFTHLEVNSLAFLNPQEPETPHEFYAPFYTYCPGLSHFVSSDLTAGLYDTAYLQANLDRLVHLAALGRTYGLQPGLLCFEPRSLPESFFQRYPTLRGARVDHPFRSHLPRYTLAQDHPVVREHYAQLMTRLMEAVPDLAYLSVWSNDSGAGFEHTASLYVGRNGGPYMIREWHSHDRIAQVAAQSALGWLRLMQAQGAAFNPDFEVLLRIEPFKVEHDALIQGMGNGLSLEAPSLLVRGYDLPYHHPRYPEQGSIAGSIFHVTMDEQEKDLLASCRAQGFEPKLSFAAGSSFNMEPLLGIPFPGMLYEKLHSLKAMGAAGVSAFGGLLDTKATPYCPNPAVIRAFQVEPNTTLDALLLRLAQAWVGEDAASTLVQLWHQVEEAVSYLPVVPLYSHFGFVWLRTWVRPLIPNLEAVPVADRQYYEQYMVSTANNPNINDLGRDVLFELISPSSGQQMADQFDEEVLPRLMAVQAALVHVMEDKPQPAFIDLHDRVRALRCWATTQRNTCAWVAGVHGYLDAQDVEEKAGYVVYLQDMIDQDLANTHALLDLWTHSHTAFMLVSAEGETPFIYGENFGELLWRKIALTEQYRHVTPAIDPDIIWRLPGEDRVGINP